jgi:uncharacterized protein YggL (DUF469 family)
MRKLTTDDILDLRAYERVRDAMRAENIARKKRRRVHLGEFVTVVFENTDTMRFQIQEMARAEKMLRDDQIEHEVATYNELVPDPGQLSCTLFIELDDEWKLREWLPRLVGIHDALVVVLPDGREVRGYDPTADRLTREDITAAVHFLKIDLTADEQRAFAAGPVRLRLDHPEYAVEVELTADQHQELVADLAGEHG